MQYVGLYSQMWILQMDTRKKNVVFMGNSIQFCDIVYNVQDRAEMPKEVLG